MVRDVDLPTLRVVSDAHARGQTCFSASRPVEELTDADWFNLVVDECARSVTLWLKRLRRSRSAGSVRYLLVAEAHKSGQPHFHVLLHEYGQPIPARELEAVERSRR